MKVGILMGSKSDAPVMEHAITVLNILQLDYEMRVLSAHRTPKETVEWTETAEERGIRVIICGAGMAAHLAGAVAAHTTLPVIGVPIPATLMGIDSLLSTVQMPPGIPVATVGIGKAGAKNAAYLAAQIIGLNSTSVRNRVSYMREKARIKILEGT